MTTNEAANQTRTAEGRLSPALLVGGAFALSTVLSVLMHVGQIVFTDADPYAPSGAVESIVATSIVGGAGLVLALAIALPLSRDPERARLGAIVLGSLSVVSLAVSMRKPATPS